MDMRIPMEQLTKCLDGRNHAGYDILSIQHAPDFGLDARPGAGGKFAQQLSVETCMHSQTFGNGKNHLSVRNGQTNIFGDVDGGQQSPLLVAGGTGAPLLAGIGNEPGTMFFMVVVDSSGNERERSPRADPHT